MDEKKLTIYFTSDLHGYIYPTDYRGQGEKELGLFKCASLIRKDGVTYLKTRDIAEILGLAVGSRGKAPVLADKPTA